MKQNFKKLGIFLLLLLDFAMLVLSCICFVVFTEKFWIVLSEVNIVWTSIAFYKSIKNLHNQTTLKKAKEYMTNETN